jgi:putative DNA primase/helicase
MLVGPGRNGKSVLIKIIEAFIGPENASHASIQEIGEDRFSSADLCGKLINSFADLRAEKLINSSLFKTLVSGDTIRAQKKHQQPFKFRNYAKLIFSANRIPQSEDRGYAYYRRWVIIPFDRIFDGKEEDTRLIDKLITQNELSGLLNLALNGLNKLIKEGGFKFVPVQRIQQQYEHSANIVKQFVDEQCIINFNNPEHCTLTTTLQVSFRMFCKTRGIISLDDNVLGRELRDFGITRDRITIRGKRGYYYVGVKTKEELRGQNQTLIPA